MKWPWSKPQEQDPRVLEFLADVDERAADAIRSNSNAGARQQAVADYLTGRAAGRRRKAARARGEGE